MEEIFLKEEKYEFAKMFCEGNMELVELAIEIIVGSKML